MKSQHWQFAGLFFLLLFPVYFYKNVTKTKEVLTVGAVEVQESKARVSERRAQVAHSKQVQAEPRPQKPSLNSDDALRPNEPIRDELPAHDDIFGILNHRHDYFEAHVIPKMGTLSSPCKIICAQSIYTEALVIQNPEYEKNFFEANPDVAFSDPEFRVAAEVLLNGSKVDPKPNRDEERKAQIEMERSPEDSEKMETYLRVAKKNIEQRKIYRKKFNAISKYYEKYRELRSLCNAESPQVLEAKCFKLLPNGQFPRL